MRLLPTFENIQNDIVKASENIPFVFIHKPTLHFLIIVDRTVIRFATIYTKGNAGYDVLYETFNYITFRVYVHRLIASLFVHNPCPNIFDRVDHIDRNTRNNDISNLRWVNHRLNMINTSKKNVRSRTYLRKNGKLASYWKKSLGPFAYVYSDIVLGSVVKIRVYFNSYNKAIEFAKKDKVRRFNKLYLSYINNESTSSRGETPGCEGTVHRGFVPGVHRSSVRPAANRARYCRFTPSG